MDLNLALGIMGALTGVVGIPITYHLARRGRRRPVIRYIMDGDVIASEEAFSSELLFSENGQPVKGLAQTYLALWNHQGDTVRGSDITPDDPLRLQLLPEDVILQVRLLGWSRQQNKLSTTRKDSFDGDGAAVLIDFDFLDANDGGVIEVLHQGPKSLNFAARSAALNSLRAELLRSTRKPSRKLTVSAFTDSAAPPAGNNC